MITDPRTRPIDQILISLILPVYNEAEVLVTLHETLESSARAAGCNIEFIYINDGSTDRSGTVLNGLAAKVTTSPVRILHLSRNFGHQAAVLAGLSHARGDAAVVMDSDMQDDPMSLGSFLAQWRMGFDVVYAVRIGRKESRLKRVLFHLFYRLVNTIAQTPLPLDAGNFGLIDGRIAKILASLPETDRYYAGLRAWVGFKQTGILVERGPRYDGRPRVSYWGLFRLAKSAIFSFSSFPLTLFYTIGFVSFIVFFGLSAFTLYHKIFTGMAIPGWTSGILTSSFMGALNALGIAVLGEYVLRIYDQVRGRPPYLIDRIVESPEKPQSASE